MPFPEFIFIQWYGSPVCGFCLGCVGNRCFLFYLRLLNINIWFCLQVCPFTDNIMKINIYGFRIYLLGRCS